MDTKGAGWLEISFKISVDAFNEILADTDLTKPLARAKGSPRPEDSNLLLSLTAEWMLRSDPRRILNASLTHHELADGKVRASPSYQATGYGTRFERENYIKAMQASVVEYDHDGPVEISEATKDAFAVSSNRRRK